jgi:hypothetical protein
MVYLAGREIPMTPNGAITWEAINLTEGTLYLPGQNPAEDERVAGLLQTDPRVGKLIAEGNQGGAVFLPPDPKDHDLVVKEFRPRVQGDIARRGRLSDLRANFVLAAGLEAVSQRRATWRIRGATVLGALVPRSVPNAEWQARWIMKRVVPLPGVDTEDYMQTGYYQEGRLIYHSEAEKEPALPSVRKRLRVYTAAFAAMGAHDEVNRFVYLDDHPENMLIERLPERRGHKTVTQGLSTKIDITAQHGFNY